MESKGFSSGSSFRTKYKQLVLPVIRQLGIRELLWVIVGQCAGLCGWNFLCDAFNCSDQLKLIILMVICSITAVLAYIGLKLHWKSIGRYGCCIVDLFSVCFIVLVAYLESAFNTKSLIVVTCITTHLNALLQLLRLTQDIDALDVVTGALMQFCLYWAFWQDSYMFVSVLFISAVAILSRFDDYSARSARFPKAQSGTELRDENSMMHSLP